MLNKIKSNKIVINIIKVVGLLVAVFATYGVLSWAYTGDVYGISDVSFSIDEYDKIDLSNYVGKSSGLFVNGKGVYTSKNTDPHFKNIEVEGKRFIVVYVNRLENTRYNRYTVAQVFIKNKDKSFIDEDSVRLDYKLHMGYNLIDLGTADYEVLRFDITTEKNTTIGIESFSLTDKFVFPKLMWVWLFVTAIIYFVLIFMWKTVKKAFSKLFYKQEPVTEYQNQGIFKSRSKAYWIFVVLAVALAYGFALTSISVGIDDLMYDETYMVDPYVAIGQGRWVMNFLANFFDTYDFLQYWRGFIGLVGAVIGVTIWCYLFEKASKGRFNDKACTIFAVLTITCPYIAYVFVFNMCTFELGLKYTMTGIVMLLFYNSMFEENKKKKLIQNIAMLILLLLVGGETIYIYLFIGLCEIGMLIFLFDNEDKKLNFKKCLLHTIRLLAISVVNLILFKIIAKLYMKIYGIQSNGYKEGYIKYDSSLSIGENIENFLENFLERLNRYLHGDLSGLMLCIGVIIIMTIGIIYSIKKKNALFLICSLGISILPFALMIVTGNTGVPKRTLIVFGLAYGFVFALLYILIEPYKLKNYKYGLGMVFLCIVGYIVIFQTKEMNMVFDKEYTKYQTDIKIMNDIETELQKIDSRREKSVIFIGYPNYTKYNCDEVVGASVFMWDRREDIGSELRATRIKAFFKYHGYYINIAEDYDLEEIIKALEDKPTYPREGYVFEYEDYIIVNLGYNSNIYEFIENAD